MLDVSVIILTYNEEIHIRRCLENVNRFASNVFVVDCFSTDKTVEIAKSLGANVIQHVWPGNQAKQFNWALDNLDIKTNWILRLDADEYVTNELMDELNEKLPHLSEQVSAVVLPLGRAFLGRILKHGIVNGIKMIRLFRVGRVRYEVRLMDEHLKVLEGDIVSFNGKFIDDNRDSLKHFIDKHNNYSSREAALLLDAEYEITKMNEMMILYFVRRFSKKDYKNNAMQVIPYFGELLDILYIAISLNWDFWMEKKVFYGIFCKAGGIVHW